MSSTCNASVFTNVVSIFIKVCAEPGRPADPEKVKIYSNPNAAGRILFVEGNIYEGSTFELRTILGVMVDHQVISRAPNMIKIKLPFNVASGTYILTVKNKDQQFVEKIILANY